VVSGTPAFFLNEGLDVTADYDRAIDSSLQKMEIARAITFPAGSREPVSLIEIKIKPVRTSESSV
jgi:hypothetical protein